MRRFTSYGPINKKSDYYVPRTKLIERAYQSLVGDMESGGQYITSWAPRQAGKTWIMQEVVRRLREEDRFDVAITTLQSAKHADSPENVLQILVDNLSNTFDKTFPKIDSWEQLGTLFTDAYFDRPVILILDEFDALDPKFIAAFANEFRSMYLERQNQAHTQSNGNRYLLHGLALIGIRGVLGIENERGSPFNIQQSLHIPNLTHAEVESLFRWYEEESGQTVEQAVIDRTFYETQGQPGLVGWFGELLTQEYNDKPDQPLTEADFDYAYIWATQGLANNNISNLISKANHPDHKDFVLSLFKTGEKIPFQFDNETINFLYLNGVIEPEKAPRNLYVKFASPFVQKRLFSRFTTDLFGEKVSRIFDPFEDLTPIINDERIDIKNLMHRYEQHLQQNREWLFKDAPRRKSDLRIFEAVYHFHIYMYLYRFLEPHGAEVWPEFPTGNGQMDIFVRFADKTYGLEIKSFVSQREYQRGLEQAARYGQQLGHTEMWLVLFVEGVDDENRQKYEKLYTDKTTGVLVHPVLIAIGI